MAIQTNFIYELVTLILQKGKDITLDNKYYWDLLAENNDIEQEEFTHNINPQIENNNLKTLAFCELIRRGEKFQIESNREEIQQKEAENKKKIFTSDNIDVPELTEVIKIKGIDQIVYSLELEKAKQYLKSEYSRLILKQTGQDKDSSAAFNIEIPDIYAEMDDTEEKPAEPINEEKVKKSKENINKQTPDEAVPIKTMRTENYQPVFEGDIKYNRDPHFVKSLDTFCMNHTRLVYAENGQTAIVDFNIYPLQFAEDAPITDILVVALSGKIVRAAMSRGASAAVQIDFDEMSFMVRGSWEDREFMTQVNCLDRRFADKFKQQTDKFMPAHRTYTTYMQEDLYNKTYSFFPATVLTNTAAGCAICAAVTDMNGVPEILLSNEFDQFTVVDQDGLPSTISLYWRGGNEPKLFLELTE